MPDHRSRNQQLVRQWNMLMKLASHRTVGVTVGELKEEHGVTRRTIERDLEALCEAGFPIAVVSQQGAQKYWGVIGPAPGLPPFPLDQDELIAVWMACGLFDFFEGTPYKEGMDRVRTKIASTLPPRVVAMLEDMQSHFAPTPHPHAVYQGKQDVVAAINKAMLAQRICKMSYFNPTWDAPRDYVIKPCGILVHRQILYLAALLEDFRDVTIFALARILQVTPTDERFDLPDGFSLAKAVSGNFGIFTGKPQTVRVRFDPDVAHFPEEIQFHPSQVNSKNPDGSMDVTLNVGGLDEVVWWLLSYGDQVRALEPPELVDQVRDTATAITAKYRIENA